MGDRSTKGLVTLRISQTIDEDLFHPGVFVDCLHRCLQRDNFICLCPVLFSPTYVRRRGRLRVHSGGRNRVQEVQCFLRSLVPMIDVHFPPFTRALWCNSMLQLFIESCDEQAHLSHMSAVILEALSDGWHLATDMLGQVTSRNTNPFPCHTMPFHPILSTHTPI